MKLVYHHNRNHPGKYDGLGVHSHKVRFRLVNRVSLIFKEIPAAHVHNDSGAREVAKHHYWYKYRSQLFLEGFRGRRKYRHVRKELTHKVSDRLRVTQAQK